MRTLDPDDIAETAWEKLTKRDRAETVFSVFDQRYEPGVWPSERRKTSMNALAVAKPQRCGFIVTG